jgi:hypothetical protein
MASNPSLRQTKVNSGNVRPKHRSFCSGLCVGRRIGSCSAGIFMPLALGATWTGSRLETGRTGAVRTGDARRFAVAAP